MGEMQKKRALKEYDWEKILAKTQNVYRSVATRERLAVKPARAARKLKFAQKFFSLFF